MAFDLKSVRAAREGFQCDELAYKMQPEDIADNHVRTWGNREVVRHVEKCPDCMDDTFLWGFWVDGK